MLDIIGGNHNAFVSGQSITDNVLMASKLVRGYGRSTLSDRYVIKIDLQKAFDYLDWSFTMDVLDALNFLVIFVDWIKACLTGARFSIFINEGLVGYFKGAKGVRQRDLLSSYLFVIAINVLSKLLDVVVTYKVFNYHPKCKKSEAYSFKLYR